MSKNLSDESKLFHAQGSSGCEGVESKINGGGAMCMITADHLPTLVQGYNRYYLPGVQELQHQQENLVPHRIHRYDQARSSLGPAKELPEEEASGR